MTWRRLSFGTLDWDKPFSGLVYSLPSGVISYSVIYDPPRPFRPRYFRFKTFGFSPLDELYMDFVIGNCKEFVNGPIPIRAIDNEELTLSTCAPGQRMFCNFSNRSKDVVAFKLDVIGAI